MKNVYSCLDYVNKYKFLLKGIYKEGVGDLAKNFLRGAKDLQFPGEADGLKKKSSDGLKKILLGGLLLCVCALSIFILSFPNTIPALAQQAENVFVGKSPNYQGTLVVGQKDGQGKYTWSNGDVYSGEWKNDKMNGFGVLKYSNGNGYSGTFIDNKRAGQGTIKWSNGEVYIGEWKNDQMSGEGNYTFKNGDKYLGSWANNKMNGLGKYTLKNGQTLEGTWIDNTYKK